MTHDNPKQNALQTILLAVLYMIVFWIVIGMSIWNVTH